MLVEELAKRLKEKFQEISIIIIIIIFNFRPIPNLHLILIEAPNNNGNNNNNKLLLAFHQRAPVKPTPWFLLAIDVASELSEHSLVLLPLFFIITTTINVLFSLQIRTEQSSLSTSSSTSLRNKRKYKENIKINHPYELTGLVSFAKR